ncbi:GFA family protein [Shinella daejeonensis]|uniref:GFA family protein n=1 Tax=Shinella daejeonensis TaxID=659017 RepID=UPI0020C7BEEF|nr:GFA family protein [Shinella daejeonensis]MCP8893937.1 GFA family protein [Shinella daejeonensis]
MKYEGSCHCGHVAFEVEGDFEAAIECNCSMCRRKGSLLAFVPHDRFVLATPEENASVYRFHKHVIDHRFCPICGVAPYSEGVDGEGNRMAAVNLRCIPAVDLDALTVRKVDGRSF